MKNLIFSSKAGALDKATMAHCNDESIVRHMPRQLSYGQSVGPSISDGASSLKTEWFNSEDAAKFLRLSVKSLRNLTSSGQIPFYKLGRRNRYRRDELEAILLSQKRGKQNGN